MLHLFLTGPNFNTARTYLRTLGRPVAPHLRWLFYEHMEVTQRLAPGTYIFGDLERLTPAQTERAATLWQALADAGQPRPLNHPTLVMRRYELLRTLYERGLNRFNVYRLSEVRRPERFPVFIRSEAEHRANLTPLLHSQAELDAAVRALREGGRAIDDKLIVEYCDTTDAEGRFRKYGAYIIGRQVIPVHLIFSHAWVTKSHTVLPRWTAAMLREEREYLETNPHEQAVREIAQLAGIEYGRIDYGVLDGEIQTWEINTNPSLPIEAHATVPGRLPIVVDAADALNAALLALAARSAPSEPVRVPAAARRLSAPGAPALVVRLLPLRLQPVAEKRLRKLQRLSAGRLRRRPAKAARPPH